jgi:hypothetical protein
MDWNSEDGRKFLLKAWPDGYLGVRGVFTLEGWTMNGEGGNVYDYVDGALYERALEKGGLLPKPDIHDRATWGILLADLAKSCGYPATPTNVYSLVPVRQPEGWLWKLFCMGIYDHGGPEFSCLGIWGPYRKETSVEEALVRTRAWIRKETGR